MKKPTIIKNTIDKEYFFEEGCYIWELSNSENDTEISIARARLTPNTETKPNYLQGIIERYIILDGQGDVFISDQTAQAVSSGDIVLIPQNCTQWIRNTGNNDLIFLVMCTPRFQVSHYCESDNNS